MGFIIGKLFLLGTSTCKISSYFERKLIPMLFAETISTITDRVLLEIKEWKSGSLAAICWLYTIHYKVKNNNVRVVTRMLCNDMGDVVTFCLPRKRG